VTSRKAWVMFKPAQLTIKSTGCQA
jgi:hypothetical protein